MIEKLTEEYLKDNLIEAYFINDERTRIEVLSLDEDKKTQIATVIPYDTENDQCQSLFKIIDIDMLHENTYQKKQQERKNFEELVLHIAKRDNIYSESITEKSFPDIIKILFNNVDNEDHVFALKLAFFEHPKINESDDNNLKKELRQSKNKIDTLKVALKFFK